LKQALLLLVLTACSPPSASPEMPEQRIVTIEEVKHPLALVVQEEGSCIDALVLDRRSCAPDMPDIDADLRLRAKGELKDAGYGWKDDKVAMRFSDDCALYMCTIDRSCVEDLGEDPFFYGCVDFNACCVLAAEQ
jgi:hypothetical protein